MNIVDKTIVCILVFALLAAEESDARGRHPKHSHAGRRHPHSHAGRRHPHSHAGRPRPKNCEEVGGIFRVHGCKRISEVPYTSVNGKGWGKKCCIPRTCSAGNNTGLCTRSRSCDSDSSFCVRNIDSCTAAHPRAYCSIPKPVNCSSGNSSGRCKDLHSCDLYLKTSHPVQTEVCSALGKNVACCIKGPAPCSVAGQTGVCQLCCASDTSFCVPNITACSNIQPDLYCSISQPVSCSSGNSSGTCKDTLTCDLETSLPVKTDVCSALGKNAACCLKGHAPCSVAGQKGVCKLACASNTSFCVPNITACTDLHSSAYCSILKPVICSDKNISGICTGSQSCDLETSHPVQTDTCTALCKKAACCVNVPATCSVGDNTGVCKSSCDSETSFCVPKVSACSGLQPGAYCSISKPVKCLSSKNDTGCCRDVCTCDIKTSYMSKTNSCTNLGENVGCCSDTVGHSGQKFMKANVSGIYDGLVMEVINPVENLTCCYNLCALKSGCKAFALFENETNGDKICKLMQGLQFCNDISSTPELNLIDYYEIEVRDFNVVANPKTDLGKPPAGPQWPGDCWSPTCRIAAPKGLIDRTGIDDDVDLMVCQKHSSDFQLSASDYLTVNVTADLMKPCPPNYLLTAVHDETLEWKSIDYYKCHLLEGNWKTVDGNCTNLLTPSTATSFFCPTIGNLQLFLAGIARSKSSGIQAVRCCPVERIQY